MAQDGLGSVRTIIDNTLSVDTVQTYDPIGNPMGSYGAGFGFTGEQTDDTGQLYLRARYYDPSIGTFTALDPFEGVMDRPMSLNGYSWVSGNPVNRIDPTGKYDWDTFTVEQDDNLSCIAKEGGLFDVDVPFSDGSNLYYAQFLEEVIGLNPDLIDTTRPDYPIKSFFVPLYLPDSITLSDGRSVTNIIATGKANSGTSCGPISALRRELSGTGGETPPIPTQTPVLTTTPVPTPTCTPTPVPTTTPNTPSIWDSNCQANRRAVNPLESGGLDLIRINSVGIMVGREWGVPVFGFAGFSSGGTVIMMVGVNNGQVDPHDCAVYGSFEAGSAFGIDLNQGEFIAAVVSNADIGGFEGLSANFSGDVINPNVGLSRNLTNCDYTSFFGTSTRGFTAGATASFTFGLTVRFGSCQSAFKSSYSPDWIANTLAFAMHNAQLLGG